MSPFVVVGSGLPLTDRPPLDPSSEQAREWVREELARGYQTEPGLWERFTTWLRELFSTDPTGGATVPSWVGVVVLVVVLALLAVVISRFVRPEARARRSGDADGVLDDPTLSAADYRTRAAAALASGDVDAALLDAYRALAARSVERTLLSDLPGRTAHEVARELATSFPDDRDALARAATAFDAVRYGHLRTTADTARQVLDLDESLAATRPHRPDPLGTPVGTR